MKILRHTKTKWFLSCFTLVTFCLASNSIVVACGPDWYSAKFSFESRPDDDLADFAAGNLGILKPDYARSYLIVAYRHLKGFSLNKREQAEVVRLWHERLGIEDKPFVDDQDVHHYERQLRKERDMRDAIDSWFQARQRVVKDKKPELDINRVWKSDRQTYSFFLNCTKNAFETAAKTLEQRIKDFGVDNPLLENWVLGQDVVFSNCSSGQRVPGETASNDPEWLKKDRQYQIGAALFYAGEFDKARRLFRRIADDKDSQWQNISDYLVARTYLRQSSLDPDHKRNLLEKAEGHLFKIIEDDEKLPVHAMSRQLLYLVANRSKSEERFRKYSILLSSPGHIPSIYNEIDNYTYFLDSGGKTESTKYPEKKIVVNKIPSETFWDWLYRLFFGSSEASPKQISVEGKASPGRTLDLSESGDLYESKREDFFDFKSENGFWRRSEIEKEYEISDWIRTFQAIDKSSYEHAYSKWKKTNSELWLIAAMSAAENDFDTAGELMAGASEVPADSKAFATVKYHQIRLLYESGEFKKARSALNEISSARLSRMPVSTQNHFSSIGMLTAANLKDFLHFAKRRAIAVGRYADFVDQTPHIRESPYGTRDLGILRERSKWMFDVDAAEIFNKRMPLRMLVRAGEDSELPGYLRERILVSAWTRAVLLNKSGVEREVAEQLGQLGTPISTDFNDLLKSKSRLSRVRLMLKNPVIRPLVDSGFARRIIPSNSLGYDRDNWWYIERLEKEHNHYELENIKEFRNPIFLTDQDLAVAEQEREALYKKGAAGDFLGNELMKALKRSPVPVDTPQLIDRLLRANRYGEFGEDRSGTKWAFRYLHRNYPKSKWVSRNRIMY